MYRVRRDGTEMDLLYDHGNDEFVVHETFLGSTGDLVFTVWPKALKRMSWLTGEISTIADFNAWHISPNRAGTKVLCDTNHPDVGLQLVDASNGRLKRGTVYVTLGRLQQKRFIESEQEPPLPDAIGLPRRLYRPTALGVRALHAFSQLSKALAWQDQ